MYKRPIVPGSFVVPERLECDGFHLRMLSVHDTVKDFAAVMDAGERLVGAMEPGSVWPRGLTIEENLIDLAWHHREFTIRHSFAYTVMNDDENRCLGCCYINPSDREAFDAVVFYWARDIEFDEKLGKSVREFIKSCWPFVRVAYPGRDIAWSNW